MSLDLGSTLGTYTLTDRIGSGGMGEVYRATDSKLGREVAVKTLPAALADDKDRLARFEREAKLLAALNHPHIASVYSLGEQDGTVFIAMELVEGETLEAQIERGPLPLDEALRIALQIAEALEAAHEKGVVHRDLKPANIMVNRNGQVKVLDFGLAKAFVGNPNEASPVHSPALSVAMTQQGLVLGTAGYMSPEQASGQGTDQRADVWSFGVVLYEMLTGQPVFSGETVPHILAAVLQSEPNWSLLPNALHPKLPELLRRCLTKRPRNRFHSIADVRIELESALADPTGAAVAESAAGAAAYGPSAGRVAGIVAAAAILAAVAGWWLRPVPEPEPGPVVRFSVPLPSGQVHTAPPVSMIAISPDGTQIAYVADNQIYLRQIGDAEVRPLLGTQPEPNSVGALTPTFSPDGRWLAYIDAERPLGPYELMRIPVSGGAPVLLHRSDDAANFQLGLTWPTDDSIMFVQPEGIVRMPANGGALELLIAANDDEQLYSPQLLPGGDAVLYTRTAASAGGAGAYESGQVIVQSIGSDDRKVIWEGGSAARYVPSGHLVYAQGSALFAIAFDPLLREISGGPVPLINNLRRSSNGASDTANFAVSDTGTFAMLPGLPGAADSDDRIETTVAWVDREGREEPLPIRADDYTMARVSPDGTKIALVVGASLGRARPPAIWVYDLETRNLSLLTTDPEVTDGPVWSADSRRIYFRSPSDTGVKVNVIELATGEVTLVGAGSDDGFPFPMPYSLAPDGETLAVINAQNEADVDIATLSLSEGRFTRLLFGAGMQNEPAISPNGEWMAHTVQGPETIATEINIRPFPAVFRTLIPVGQGSAPVFSRDGSELFFNDGDAIVAAAVTYEPSFSVSPPTRVLESSNYLWFLFGRAWDPHPSGERFIVIHDALRGGTSSAADAERLRIDVVLNWFEELKTRVPKL